MKVCNNCGATINDTETFCSNCGSSVPVAYQRNAKEPISIGGWIGRTLIPAIPLVGGIVYLIMLFIWSGDQKKEDTFRNWAKAQLIFMAISVVLAIIFVVIFGAAFSDVFEELMYYM